MLNIDFYILQKNQMQSLHFVCQLLEKSYQQKQNVYVHLNSEDEAKRFDELLWTYRDDSFIPHQIYNEHDEFHPLIQIGYEGMSINALDKQVLFNLSNEIPVFYQSFTRIIEIVFAGEPMQQLARKRYKHYRDQGYEINTIKSDE